jgi:hypothetical protein
MREGALKNDNEQRQDNGNEEAHLNSRELQRANDGHRKDKEVPQLRLQVQGIPGLKTGF